MVFLCNWCATLAAELAGSNRLAYPAGVRVVKVPCAGRINPLHLLRALQNGADGILVFGCHPGDCHYAKGNLLARRRLSVLKGLLEAVGMEPARLQFSWVTASEGSRFATLLDRAVQDVRTLGPNRKFVKNPAAAG